MAKHYRHPIHTQIGLFFHGSAAGAAYASPATWASLRTGVHERARGVPVLVGVEGKEKLHYLYDINDTRDPLRQDSHLTGSMKNSIEMTDRMHRICAV